MEEKKVIVVDDSHKIASNVASLGLTKAMCNSIIGPALAIQALGGWMDSEPRRRNFTEPYHGPSKDKKRARKAQRQARRRNRR